MKHQGLTLIELAIVLVIISVLLGAVMQGSSLISQSRAQRLIDDVEQIQTTWVLYRERFNAYPGDHARASNSIDSHYSDGNGNGLIDALPEAAAVWQHLAGSGLLSGAYTGSGIAVISDLECSDGVCPGNPYGGYYKIAYSDWGANGNGQNELYSGANIPADVLAALDRQLDDGSADTGSIRFHADATPACASGSDWAGVDQKNCAAAIRLP